jgi:hypothetical protein
MAFNSLVLWRCRIITLFYLHTLGTLDTCFLFLRLRHRQHAPNITRKPKTIAPIMIPAIDRPESLTLTTLPMSILKLISKFQDILRLSRDLLWQLHAVTCQIIHDLCILRSPSNNNTTCLNCDRLTHVGYRTGLEIIARRFDCWPSRGQIL